MLFGTDGIRGTYGKEITPSLAFRCGCATSNLCKRKRVLIAKDTRTSGDVLSLSLTNGLLSSGVDVLDIGIAPTPVVSFLVDKLNCDYGIMITASHNPKEDNGIKFFSSDGYKISEKEENEIEKFFAFNNFSTYDKLGKYKYCPSKVNLYKNYLLQINKFKLDLKIVVDCSYGATYALAKKIFPAICEKVHFVCCKNNGMKINEKCGALHPENLKHQIKKFDADLGFAFDGDGDRIVCCDKYGNILDGDDILSILSLSLHKNEKFIVGTIMSNKGFEEYLSSLGLTLLRSDVGDKFVAQIMKEKNLSLGGEPSGHIIIKNLAKTGDGILTACTILKTLFDKNEKISKLIKYKKYHQVFKNIKVNNKYRILNDQILNEKFIKIKESLNGVGRIVLRASGTEEVLRIMCEHKDKKIAEKTISEIESIVMSIK